MKVINCQTLGEVCEHMLDGEPVFLIRAQDSLSVKAIQDYLDTARRHGAKNTGRSTEKLERFVKWQKENPNKVKLPD